MNPKNYRPIAASDVRLNTVSRQIESKEFGGEFLRQVLESMEQIALNERDAQHIDRPSLVGLAAPQIGAFVQVILFDMQANALKTNLKPDIRFVINPRIVSVSEERELGREGCYSTGDVHAVVRRHTSLTMVGFDQTGKSVSYDLEGFQTRIVQHEVDHLTGIRCPDRIESPKHLHKVLDSEFQDYRERWETWDKYYKIDDWLKIKRGEK